MRRFPLTIIFFAMCLPLWVQAGNHIKGIYYTATLQGCVGANDETTPFWLTNNRYGLGNIECNAALVRTSFQRDAETDSLRKWRIGYGADIVGMVKYDGHCNSHLVLQQLYTDFQFKGIRLSIGQKERPSELKNQNLSTGGLTTGINARPLPMVRLELPDFLPIPGTKNWLAIKAHIAYGIYTDNRWQEDFTHKTNLYTANSFYHSKAGFLRIGNPKKSHMTLTAGLEMSCQFGGEAWNLRDRADHTGTFDSHQKLPHGGKAFWHAFIPGGSDTNDGDYANVEGNQLGSWHLRLDFYGKGWGMSFYAEHFFEDHSMLFLQYPWKDMLYGAEINLPRNPVVSSIVYEYLRTADQSGPIYHDANDILPEQISAIDNYYNHHIYGGWQHAGFGIGNPLLLSPLYNSNHKIAFTDNRITAHHIGLEGHPCKEGHYRILFTHEKSLGTYSQPHSNPKNGKFLLIEGTYSPRRKKGLNLTFSYGQNSGTLLGSSKGGMLTISYKGQIKKK